MAFLDQFRVLALLCLFWILSPAGQPFAAAAPGFPGAEPISPLPDSFPADPRKTELGRRLFLDPRLSADDSVSCASCHALGNAGVDGLPRSLGVKGAVGDLNSPTVYNSGLLISQFWNGRAATLEEQIEGPVNSPVEMASNWPQIIARLRGDSWYPGRFRQLYDDGITAANIKDAIATFERTLLTPDSRFDRYLKGDGEAISETEKAGYRLFKRFGCSSCHQGRLAGGNMYEKLGIIKDYFEERGDIKEADFGRFNVTGNEEHKFEFKVPGLRNVALTAPYLHDGSVETLEEVVWIMGYHQLGRRISGDDVDRIVAFLKTLTGRFPEQP